jgi:hypothetical protein
VTVRIEEQRKLIAKMKNDAPSRPVVPKPGDRIRRPNDNVPRYSQSVSANRLNLAEKSAAWP